MTMLDALDARARRTRRAIVDAFGRLVLRNSPRPIRAADVIAEAGVGRSTFYEHFSSSERVLMAALAEPFAILADTAVGVGDPDRTAALLRHFWENRQRARDFLTGRLGEQAQRLLTALVEERLDAAHAAPSGIAARQLAAAAYAPLRAWLLGEVTETPELLAAALCRSGSVLAGSFRTA